MATNLPIFAVVGDQLTPERREVIHELVKEHANGWWHNFADLWLVGGKTAVEWRDMMKHIVAGSSATILVFPVKTGGGWAGAGKDATEKMKWLFENL